MHVPARYLQCPGVMNLVYFTATGLAAIESAMKSYVFHFMLGSNAKDNDAKRTGKSATQWHQKNKNKKKDVATVQSRFRPKLDQIVAVDFKRAVHEQMPTYHN